MDMQQSWKLKFSFKNATMVLCLVNVVTALFLLQGFLSPSSSSSSRKYQSNGRLPLSVLNKLMKESEEMRLAMQPLELIKRLYSSNFLRNVINRVAQSRNHDIVDDDNVFHQEGESANVIGDLVVREIEQEAYAEPETDQQKDTKQTAAFDLSKRLNNFRSTSDGANQKALEEWRKRKMERARQRELGRNGTASAQA